MIEIGELSLIGPELNVVIIMMDMVETYQSYILIIFGTMAKFCRTQVLNNLKSCISSPMFVLLLSMIDNSNN